VTRVRRTHAAHPAAIVGAVQPTDELRPDASAQHASPLEARALARDDQDDPEILRHRGIEKVGDGTFGCGERHAVQVERRLRDELAAPKGTRRVAVKVVIIEDQFRR